MVKLTLNVQHAVDLPVNTTLRTLLYEAMAIINSYPLTVDGINDPQALEPLPLKHLITMKSKVALPPLEDFYITKKWREVQHLTGQFWSRWEKSTQHNHKTEMALTSAQPQSQ